MRFLKRADRAKERSFLDTNEGAWIVAGRRPFAAHVVGSLVPVAFEQYARILHPARSSLDAPVRWAAVAGWSGRTIHALAQWDTLRRPLGETSTGRPFNEPPDSGGLRGPELAALCRVLAAHTTTAADCYIAVWCGYGWLDWANFASRLELRLDQRTFVVRRGAIEMAREVGWRHPEGTFASEPPSLIWPADRAWFVASDVDLDSTYIGGSSVLIDAVLANERLESWGIGPADPITADSDVVNGR